MDFTLVEKIEADGFCYKLLKSNFYRNYYVIIAQDKRDFYCGSICAPKDEATALFLEIANSRTDIYCVRDILCEFDRQKV